MWLYDKGIFVNKQDEGSHAGTIEFFLIKNNFNE